VVEAERSHQARTEVLEHDIALADQLRCGGAPLGRLDIEDDALLVAIEGAEKTDAQAGQRSRLVAARRLDLDDLRAHAGQQARYSGGGGHAGKVQDTKARQGWVRSPRCLLLG
jgi:hypothetical protein